MFYNQSITERRGAVAMTPKEKILLLTEEMSMEQLDTLISYLNAMKANRQFEEESESPILKNRP